MTQVASTGLVSEVVLRKPVQTILQNHCFSLLDPQSGLGLEEALLSQMQAVGSALRAANERFKSLANLSQLAGRPFLSASRLVLSFQLLQLGMWTLNPLLKLNACLLGALDRLLLVFQPFLDLLQSVPACPNETPPQAKFSGVDLARPFSAELWAVDGGGPWGAGSAFPVQWILLDPQNLAQKAPLHIEVIGKYTDTGQIVSLSDQSMDLLTTYIASGLLSGDTNPPTIYTLVTTVFLERPGCLEIRAVITARRRWSCCIMAALLFRLDETTKKVERFFPPLKTTQKKQLAAWYSASTYSFILIDSPISLVLHRVTLL